MTGRQFHLGDLLSVTAGRMFSPDGLDGMLRLLAHVEPHLFVVPEQIGPWADRVAVNDEFGWD